MAYAEKKSVGDIVQDQHREAEAALARLREEDTTGGSFLLNESLSSKATDFGANTTASNDPRYATSEKQVESTEKRYGQNASNDEASLREQLEQEEEIRQERSYREAYTAHLRTKKLIKQAKLRGESTALLKGGVRPLGSIMGVSGAWTAYSLQFLFAAISLVFIAAKGVYEAVVEGSTLIKLATKFVGLFFDIQSFAPLEVLMMTFWGLAVVVAVGTFVGFLIWFTLTGVRVFSSTSRTLLTALVFTFSILPVFNLFPWIPLWVMFIHMSNVYTSSKELFRG